MIKIQTEFKDNLLTNVTAFKQDTSTFYHDYETVWQTQFVDTFATSGIKYIAFIQSGPTVEGIEPREASDRLATYQSRMDELWRRFQTYSGGEVLFGLQSTDYPKLSSIKKELNLLQKLYSLYNTVVDSVDGYYDVLWAEVDTEKINLELLDFQTKCRKLPKALKEYSAFHDLKKKIDDFSETCPLLEMMANPAMKDRHWQRLEEITGHKFDVESESFQLGNVMEAPLLENREDIEVQSLLVVCSEMYAN